MFYLNLFETVVKVYKMCKNQGGTLVVYSLFFVLGCNYKVYLISSYIIILCTISTLVVVCNPQFLSLNHKIFIEI